MPLEISMRNERNKIIHYKDTHTHKRTLAQFAGRDQAFSIRISLQYKTADKVPLREIRFSISTRRGFNSIRVTSGASYFDDHDATIFAIDRRVADDGDV